MILDTRAAVIVLSLSAISAIAYIIWSVIYNLFFHPLHKYPGPKTWAISVIPSIRNYISGRGHRDLHQLHRRYGPIVRVAPDELSFSSAEAWKEIMGHSKDSRHENGKDFVFTADAATNIIGANHDDHRRFRRILSNGFSAKAMQDQQPMITGYVDLLFQRLHENCKNGNESLDVVAWYNYTTFDIIGDLAFGESFGCLDNSNYHPWVSLIFQSIKAGAFMTAARLLGPTVNALVKRFIPKRLLEMREQHLQLVHERVAKRLADTTSRPDFMSSMIRQDKSMVRALQKPQKSCRPVLTSIPNYHKYDQDIQQTWWALPCALQNMSLDEVRSHANILILAGSETTATTLSGATYLLCMNPQVFEKLAEEVRTTFTEENEIDLFSVQNLPYMLAVIEESMRIFPPVPSAIPRRTPPGGNMVMGDHIPGDTKLAIWQWVMNRNPENFTEPDSFIPERWLGDPRFDGDKKQALQPFSVGPRNCIGKNLAYAETRLILARMIWNFDFKIADHSKRWIDDNEVYTIWQKTPLDVYLKPRVETNST